MKATFENCILALVLVPATVWSAHASEWPVVRPLEEKRAVISPAKGIGDTPFEAFIKDSVGVPIYKLECHNGDYDDDSVMNFSGDFQCALFAVKGTAVVSGNLLAANTRNERSTDWWNRGRMLSAQLRGECLGYPEYSTIRHFKLRGMLLTLRFSEVRWSSARDRQLDPLIGSFTLAVSAVPDATARSSTAATVAGPAPPASCYP